MESKNTCIEVFGKRLKELRKANGYTIEQFAELVGISKSTVGYYENDKRMPDIEILSRITNVLNVSADYLIGKTNTTAMRGKMKTVCDFTGLSDTAVEYLVQLVKDKRYETIAVINHLFEELSQDTAFYSHEKYLWEELSSSVLGAVFLYFEKYAQPSQVWEELVDITYQEQDRVVYNAYRQYLLNMVMDNVKTSAEAYKEDNKPWKA